MLTLVVSTLVLVLVALIATSSFMVIAQRRLPQLGMMSAIGATEKHLRLTMLAAGAVTGVVAAVIGTVLGLAAWVALAPSVGNAVGHRLDVLNIPGWLVLAAVLLAILAATVAAWWPARTMARIPTVLALSGRPPSGPPPSLVSAGHRVPGRRRGVLGDRQQAKTGSASGIDLVLIAVGMLGVIVGVLLVSPLAIQALARLADAVPVAARLALRDLSRYRSRSGAALAAIVLALGIVGVDRGHCGRGAEQRRKRQLGVDPGAGAHRRPARPRRTDAATNAQFQAGVDEIPRRCPAR